MNGNLWSGLTLVFVLGLFIVVPTYLLISSQILAILKGRYSSIFEKLGKPSLFVNNSITTSGKFVEFIFSKRIIDDTNGDLKTKAIAARVLLILGVLLTAMAIACLFLGN